MTRVVAAACFAVLACLALSGSVGIALDDGSAYVPGAEWRSAPPAAVGFDRGALDALSEAVNRGRYGSIDGLLVVRHGYLVVEQYPAWSAQEPHTLQSVTKSVTSLLFGILHAQRPAPMALDRPVVDVFSRYPSITNLDDRKRALTVRDLLEMRTGMAFWEQPYPGSPLDELNRSRGDWVKLVLDRPMTSEPGSAWAYNSGAAILICGAIREVAGIDADELARRELFGPLGITGESWATSPYDGLPHCGGGLSLKPTDLARIGYLVLRHGRWGDRQVVPASWIDESVQPISRGPELLFSAFDPGYGYFWWLFPAERGGHVPEVIAASGSGGQWLFVVPALDLVVAIVAEDGDGLDLLYDLLPTVH